MWVLGLWIKEANKGLFRNLLMNAFALLLAIICFSLMAFFTVIGMNAKYISSTQEEKVPVVLLLKDEITDYQEIESRIKELKEVKEYTFISKDEAYEEMKQSLGEKDKMLTGLGFNPLPASFEMKLNNPRDINKVVKTIESWGVDKNVKYGKEFLDNFFSVTDKINQIAFWIIIIMSVATGAVIYSSIRMNILNRNKEIEIKNLIGAGSLNIKVPFILEAVLLTTLSASVILAAVFFFYNDMIGIMLSGLPMVTFMEKDQVIKSLVPLMYFVAIVIGIVSSFLSTQRYLKRH